MKFLIDENLSFKIATFLKPQFKGSCHVSDVGLTNEDDILVWKYAKEKDFVIVTKDNDFVHFSNLLGCPPKVIRLRGKNLTTKAIKTLLNTRIDLILEFYQNSGLCLLEIHYQ